MKKNISIDIMKRISKNLMIEISEDELNTLMEEISISINELEKLSIFKTKEFSIEDVNPMNYPNIKTKNDFRDDIVYEFDNKDELLDLANEKENKLIKV